MLLEVSKEQIKALKDDELRDLIVKLSEATLKKNNISNKVEYMVETKIVKMVVLM